ncbi:MAG: dNTP triphosphohydrolase, partial [Chitinophagaceae bacterium]|nr:dNTP triphosphohydrolase [Chitinophagaceae bacterium]
MLQPYLDKKIYPLSPMYKSIILPARRKESSILNRNLLEETASDRSRVIFSSSFRRLQQKAQVFSLETNAAVRSRLTHSLEVADYGRLIAQNVTNRLISNGMLDSALQIPFINIVETSCLLHDIGNLPFGHFGETAIQEWFSENWKEKYQTATSRENPDDQITDWMNDFLEFDGNPQGFRIITLLQQPPVEISGTGLNLTMSQ